MRLPKLDPIAGMIVDRHHVGEPWRAVARAVIHAIGGPDAWYAHSRKLRRATLRGIRARHAWNLAVYISVMSGRPLSGAAKRGYSLASLAQSRAR